VFLTQYPEAHTAADVLAGLEPTLDLRTTRTHNLLTRRKNIVLYGPPGTGKTHTALSIADYWLAQNGQDSVVKTTFHPSYSYQDFIEGYRPDSSNPGVFTLESGVLIMACEIAERLEAL